MITANVKVGDNLIVKAAPASHYYPIDGHEVKVINVFEHVVGKNKYVCYAFLHPNIGYGTMRDYGFQVPKNANYKRHCDSLTLTREECITHLLASKKSLEKITKFSNPYKIVQDRISSYADFLIENHGFTPESLEALYTGD